MPEGFGTGWLQGQEFNTNQAMAQLGMAEGYQKMEKTQLEIDQTKRMLEAQRAIMARISGGNMQTATDPQSQAKALAQRAFDSAEIYDQMGLPEQGIAEAKKGSELLRNAAAVDRAQALQEKQTAQYSTNLMNWVKSAPTQQEKQRRWQQAQMMFQSSTGKKSEYANQPYSDELADAIISRTTTAVQKAEEKLKTAQTAHAEAGTRLDNVTAGLRSAQTEDVKSRTKAREKNGAIVPERYVKEIDAEVRSKYDLDPGTDPALAARLRTVVTEAAEKTQELVRGGMSLSQAKKMAFDEFDKRGVFDQFRSSVKAPGSTRETAIEAKPGTHPTVPGFYKSKGQTMYWDGHSFTSPPPEPREGPVKETDEEREVDEELGRDSDDEE